MNKGKKPNKIKNTKKNREENIKRGLNTTTTHQLSSGLVDMKTISHIRKKLSVYSSAVPESTLSHSLRDNKIKGNTSVQVKT